jgi:hypothetical protein
VRYCARPPFALERIEPMKDGRIAYRMKTPRPGSTHRVMTPLEFMARLAILVPPPFFPLTRYHGVFAARSSWRSLVTPKPPEGALRGAKNKRCLESAPRDKTPQPPNPPLPTPSGTKGPPVAHLVYAQDHDATVITIRHWGRILDGELFASSSRLEWSVLLKRTHGIDALACPKCHATLRPIATITETQAVREVLTHLGVRADPLPRARARDPTRQSSFDFDAA